MSRSLKWEAGCQGRNQPERPVSPKSGRPSGKRALRAATGIRRCGKSFLLFNLYYDWLISQGVPPEQIITTALDDDRYLSCRDPSVLSETIRGQIRNREMYQVFLDEVQYAIRYEELRNPEEIRLYNVLNGLLRLRKADIHVAGSNSRLPAEDGMTAFRGRGDEVRACPRPSGNPTPFREERRRRTMRSMPCTAECRSLSFRRQKRRRQSV